jgi:uncharacterized lipoprotein
MNKLQRILQPIGKFASALEILLLLNLTSCSNLKEYTKKTYMRAESTSQAIQINYENKSGDVTRTLYKNRNYPTGVFLVDFSDTNFYQMSVNGSLKGDEFPDSMKITRTNIEYFMGIKDGIKQQNIDFNEPLTNGTLKLKKEKGRPPSSEPLTVLYGGINYDDGAPLNLIYKNGEVEVYWNQNLELEKESFKEINEIIKTTNLESKGLEENSQD